MEIEFPIKEVLYGWAPVKEFQVQLITAFCKEELIKLDFANSVLMEFLRKTNLIVCLFLLYKINPEKNLNIVQLDL